MSTDIKPIVKKIDDNAQSLNDFQKELSEGSLKKEKEILLNFPTVYIYNWKQKIMKYRFKRPIRRH